MLKNRLQLSQTFCLSKNAAQMQGMSRGWKPAGVSRGRGGVRLFADKNSIVFLFGEFLKF